MNLFKWIDGSINYVVNTKPKYIEDDYGPRLSYYDNATSAAVNSKVVSSSYLYYFS